MESLRPDATEVLTVSVAAATIYPMAVNLDSPVQYVKGVGPSRAAILASAGISTVEDLLRYRPFRYEDRTNFRKISDLRPDQEAVVQAEVLVTGHYTTPMKRVRIFEMLVGDASGAIQVKFFNQPYLDRVFRKGQHVILFGAPRVDNYSLGLSLISPEFELVDASEDRNIHTGRIVPIYRRIGRLTTRALRQIVFRLFSALPAEIDDPLPSTLREKYLFPCRREALEQLHFPTLPGDGDKAKFLRDLESSRTPFQQRLVFEEFFIFQLGLQVVRKRRALVPKQRAISTNETIRDVIKAVLPFHPTAAQKRVLREVVDDLRSPRVMNRLLQGDVGSGKTIVALQALIVVMENGYQTALMAPTEILAEQHYRNIVHYLSKTGYQVALLTGNVKGKARRSTLERIESGEIDLVVGTHALIQGGVAFKDLALVVIDEQHRFGVLQRSQMKEKGGRPDTLVMTATPIPRSLALTLYGDLDLSIIDEMPPGRQAIRTLIKSEAERGEVYSLVRQQLERGRQAFVVYPLIEESEKSDLKAATEAAEYLRTKIFPEYVVGLMHGRLKAEEKESLMGRFEAGEVQILVSTTVIEVGIDIANATLMLVEHAERFGLSQLHQLRGRIGRGRDSSLCILMTEGRPSGEAWQRLDIMGKTGDGFKIAEKDLEIRGPGEFVGTRQSGIPDFVFGNIVRDRDLLELAKVEAEAFLALELKDTGGTRSRVLAGLAALWKQRYGLYEVG